MCFYSSSGVVVVAPPKKSLKREVLRWKNARWWREMRKPCDFVGKNSGQIRDRRPNTRVLGPQKLLVAVWNGNPLISGKSWMVKCYSIWPCIFLRWFFWKLRSWRLVCLPIHERLIFMGSMCICTSILEGKNAFQCWLAHIISLGLVQPATKDSTYKGHPAYFQME